MTIFDEAQSLVNGKRQEDYGSPRDHFTAVAKVWSGFLTAALGTDVALEWYHVPNMMAMFKITREGHTHKHDNLLDAIGYLGLASDCEDGDIE